METEKPKAVSKIVPSVKGKTLAFGFGLVIASLAINFLFRVPKASVTELSLGQQISPITSEDGASILATDLKQSQPVIKTALEASFPKLLWLGNSQLPTIVDQKPGDKTAVQLLHERLLVEGKGYLLSFAPPNANLQEHLLLSAYLIKKIRPEVLILGICFDDLRENGIRPMLNDAFADEATSKFLESSGIGKTMLKEFRSSDQQSPTVSTAKQITTSTAEVSERFLNQELEKMFPVWRGRGTARSLIFVSLHSLRNTAFRIRPDSIRKLIPARYERNMHALHALLDLAQSENIKVALYVLPIRHDVSLPYEIEAYDKFKESLKYITLTRRLMYEDLDSAIDNNYWGLKPSTTVGGKTEIDYMHFKKAGHKQLADRVAKLIGL